MAIEKRTPTLRWALHRVAEAITGTCSHHTAAEHRFEALAGDCSASQSTASAWPGRCRDAQHPATDRPEGSPGALPAPTGPGTHHHRPTRLGLQPRCRVAGAASAQLTGRGRRLRPGERAPRRPCPRSPSRPRCCAFRHGASDRLRPPVSVIVQPPANTSTTRTAPTDEHSPRVDTSKTPSPLPAPATTTRPPPPRHDTRDRPSRPRSPPRDSSATGTHARRAVRALPSRHRRTGRAARARPRALSALPRRRSRTSARSTGPGAIQSARAVRRSCVGPVR